MKNNLKTYRISFTAENNGRRSLRTVNHNAPTPIAAQMQQAAIIRRQHHGPLKIYRIQEANPC